MTKITLREDHFALVCELAWSNDQSPSEWMEVFLDSRLTRDAEELAIDPTAAALATAMTKLDRIEVSLYERARGPSSVALDDPNFHYWFGISADTARRWNVTKKYPIRWEGKGPGRRGYVDTYAHELWARRRTAHLFQRPPVLQKAKRRSTSTKTAGAPRKSSTRAAVPAKEESPS